MELIADYHTHCNFSGDSEEPMENMVKQAVALGLQELVLTDHVDYDYADPVFEMIDYDEYTEKFFALQAQYRSRLKLLLGVELGYQPHIVDKMAALTRKYPFDFIIMSVHMADRQDFYTGDFFVGKDQQQAYLRYLETVLQSVRDYEGYDIYGHIDFIIRYGPYKQKKMHYDDYHDILDAILQTIICSGKGLEINTSGFRYGLGQTHPTLEFLQRYRRLGGEIVTLGSDAHCAEDICSHFPEAYELLQAAGFKYLTFYEERKPDFRRL